VEPTRHKEGACTGGGTHRCGPGTLGVSLCGRVNWWGRLHATNRPPGNECGAKLYPKKPTRKPGNRRGTPPPPPPPPLPSALPLYHGGSPTPTPTDRTIRTDRATRRVFPPSRTADPSRSGFPPPAAPTLPGVRMVVGDRRFPGVISPLDRSESHRRPSVGPRGDRFTEKASPAHRFNLPPPPKSTRAPLVAAQALKAARGAGQVAQ